MSNNLLKGKRGIIFGALDSNSIAWITAERVFEEGGTFVLTNAPVAMRMGQINELAEKTNSTVIPADATSLEDLENLITKSMEVLGGKLDFVLHSIGMSINVRKGKFILIKIMIGPTKASMFLRCPFIRLCKLYIKMMQ